MRVCLVDGSDVSNGAMYTISIALKQGLEELGVDVEVVRLSGTLERFRRNDFDLVHYMYLNNAWMHESTCPYTGSLYHFNQDRVHQNIAIVKALNPEAIMVCDRHIQRQLGSFGIYSHYAKFAIDQSWLKPLPYPDEFTVCYLGWEAAVKKFPIVREACEIAEVKCIGYSQEEGDATKVLTRDEVLALYARSSCYAVASFDDGGPIPPQEMMLCGRPVATTWVGMMPEVVTDYVSGRFHDGSPDDLAKVLDEIKRNYDFYKARTRASALNALPKPLHMAMSYLDVFEEVCGERLHRIRA